MNEDTFNIFIYILFIILGLLSIINSKSYANKAIERQKRLYKFLGREFKYRKSSIKILQVANLAGGALFITIGILALLGIIHFSK